MANLKELAEEIRKIHKKNEQTDLNKKIDLCFENMELYSNIAPKYRTKENEKDCCYAAVILSGVIQKGLSKRVVDFLSNHNIPLRAEQLLRANLRRMECF